MKILVDENIPFLTVKELRSKGFDVADVRRTIDQAISDERLWQKAQEEGRLLISTDKGFSIYRNEVHHGLLIVRLRQPTRLKIHHRVMQAINKHSEKEWPGLMVIMRDSVQSQWKSRVNT